MRFLALPLVLGMMSPFASGGIKSQTIEYQQGGTTLKGYLAYDDSIGGQRPGIVVFPEWWGLTDYPKHRAEQLAQLGYVAFAADLYGDGQTTTDPKQAAQLAGALRHNPQLLQDRAVAALASLRNTPQADPRKLAAIGYCFGGVAALQLARTDAGVVAVAVFHSSLANPQPTAPAKPISAKILVLNGGDDSFVSPEEYAAFENEMRQAKADWQINLYGNAVHAFTNPDADKAGIKGVAYNHEADLRSWEAMKLLFAEAFR